MPDLTADEILARIESHTASLTEPEPVVLDAVPARPEFRHYEPLANAADDWVSFARTTSDRVYVGIPEFDAAMRGLAPRELMSVNGFSHSGKTVFVTQMVRANAHRRIAWFTPDETRVAVLLKLAAVTHGISVEDLEIEIAKGNESVEELVRETATEHFPNLAVFDEIDDLAAMDIALTEAENVWGEKAELVVFDYLDLLQGPAESEGGNQNQKFKSLKAWGKRRNVPLVVVHQTSRTKGADGKAVAIDSGTGGGEAAATFIVGVRRKKALYASILAELREKRERSTGDTSRIDDAIREAEYSIDEHQRSITFNLVKNKRPPSKLVDDMDFTLEGSTGRIGPFHGALHSRTSSPTTVGGVSWEEPGFEL